MQGLEGTRGVRVQGQKGTRGTRVRALAPFHLFVAYAIDVVLSLITVC